MDVENMLETGDKLDSVIKLEGNYFIMDSETLVSNPFQELQQEAVNEAQKKNSMTEKLTTVKNNVCENHFNMAKVRLERQKMNKLKQLHDNSNKLRHEVKLLDLDRQKHTVEVKKRMQPDKDYTYDDDQISNTEKRLGANIASFYLEKRLKYPMRLRSVSDISVTPTVRKARASLRLHDIQKSMEETIGLRPERAQTAKSGSTTYTAPSTVFRRRGSRSAPLYARTRQADSAKSSTLPAISHAKSQGDSLSTKGKVPHNAHVKFAFDNPLKILASNEESANLFARSQTYYPGVTRAVNFPCDSSEDDDDPYLPDYIDLRALFFNGDSNGNNNDDAMSIAPSQHSVNINQHLLALRKAQGPPPKLTTDMKQSEIDYINSKINKFMENLAAPRPKTSGEVPDAPRFSSIGTTTKGTSTEEKPNPFSSNTKSTSTTDLLAHAMGNGQAPDISKPDDKESPDQKAADDQDNIKTSRKTKYGWQYIKGRPADGQLKGTYKSEDLVLQSLTGVPISNALHTHVPLHSASRAMRHTATFKMHKIVEKLINERTKYERHQIEELKRQMVNGGDDTASPGTAGELNRRVSTVTKGSLNSDRNIMTR